MKTKSTLRIRTAQTIAAVASAMLIIATPAVSQFGSRAGGFTRLGFGARGMGMGNALSAATEGTIAPYYNPALSTYQSNHTVNGTYAILSLDRKLNQISYTKNIHLRRDNAKNFVADPNLQSIIGFSVGWTNAGDGNIEGRDNDGFRTQTQSVFENQFYFTIANRFNDDLSVGLSFKFLYSGFNVALTKADMASLSSSGFGVDIGILYHVMENLNLSLVAKELVSKYHWNTGDIYGPEHGRATEDPFIRFYRLGAAYTFAANKGLATCEFEYSSEKTVLARAGIEYSILESLALRGGIDRVQVAGEGFEPVPTFGVSFSTQVSTFSPTLHYAFILDPIAPSPAHVLSFALHF